MIGFPVSVLSRNQLCQEKEQHKRYPVIREKLLKFKKSKWSPWLPMMIRWNCLFDCNKQQKSSACEWFGQNENGETCIIWSIGPSSTRNTILLLLIGQQDLLTQKRMTWYYTICGKIMDFWRSAYTSHLNETWNYAIDLLVDSKRWVTQFPGCFEMLNSAFLVVRQFCDRPGTREICKGKHFQ